MTARVIDDVEAANRLREWVKEKYGVWITHATALRAIRRICGDRT